MAEVWQKNYVGLFPGLTTFFLMVMYVEICGMLTMHSNALMWCFNQLSDGDEGGKALEVPIAMYKCPQLGYSYHCPIIILMLNKMW